MANFVIHQIPMLADNYGYLLHDPASGETTVVDPSSAFTVPKTKTNAIRNTDTLFMVCITYPPSVTR